MVDGETDCEVTWLMVREMVDEFNHEIYAEEIEKEDMVVENQNNQNHKILAFQISNRDCFGLKVR